jgi:hypothetical protein
VGTSRADATATWLYRVGGLAALVLGIACIVTIPLYLAVGAPPTGGAAWLEYSAGKTTCRAKDAQ